MLYPDSTLLLCSSRRLCEDFKAVKIQFPCIIRPDDENFPSEPSSVSKSFELLQFASVQTFQQHVRMTLNVLSAMGFLSKTHIHQVSCTFKTKTPGRQSSLSVRTSYIYGNCVQLRCDRLDDMATQSERGLIQERISAKFVKQIAQLSVRTPYISRPNGT
jgi:hypothetical protein